ncbi:MAG TPA: S41 family peptidase [Ferruginibacter sp.]|nr:S41 family peptidase [Ferruginibacter sp.]HNN71198.1 S41 family peptidase [Ferruginibacter sp.]HNO98992.1 S41 family peptidase [Ferruginibacter sp.]
MNKKIQVWLPLLFSITMIAGMYMGYKMRDNMPGRGFFSRDKRRPVQEVLDLINNRYVDDVKTQALTDTAIEAILSKLDPHSVFIPAEELQQVNEDLAGKFFGIGIEFNIFNDTLHVINVLKGGPSDKAGLLTGDKFLKVGDSVVAGHKTPAETFRKFLRGDRGSDVTITYLRGNQSKTVTITRDAIPLSSVDASYMINTETGYIRLNKFSTQTYREFMLALEDLKKAGLKKLILDLRGNGGGVLDEAVEIADEFLSDDKLITYTEGKHTDKKEYRCRRQGQFETGPLIVLADEGTASASEILIGALQDWDRATIVGRRSFGKGLVQEQFDLSDHSALRLTVARYYTPIGRSIQRPYANGAKVYYDEIMNRYHDGETQHADSVKNDTSKVYRTMGGKKVYGGGGISPDYFIALDTTGLVGEAGKVYSRNTISNFAYYYYLGHRDALNAFKTPADFTRNFQFSENDWAQFVQAAAKDTVNLSGLGEKNKLDLVQRVRAAIARHLWRNEGYYETINATDNAIQRSLELLAK